MHIDETSGRKAETVAASRLQELGYRIVARNWRTRLCEIDLIALKGNTAYCFEVKYRQSNVYGSGLDYVTTAKLKQMKKATELWLLESYWDGYVELGVIEIFGDEYEITNLIVGLTFS